MAESVGVRGIRLENPGEVESGIADALAHDDSWMRSIRDKSSC
jgi:thiamine pyrophosphate-dependent acetolactate synthase large subunit-like protein